LFYAADRIQNAVWFDEGHACFFESAAIRSGNVTVSESAWRAHILERNPAAAAANIPAVLQASHEVFYDAARRELNYATAWALVYFLRKGAPAQRIAAYEKILPGYLKALAETKDSDAATAAAFEGVDMLKLQRDFTAFWGNPRARAAARNQKP